MHTMTPEEFSAEVKRLRAMSKEELAEWRKENNIDPDGEPEVFAVSEKDAQ